MTAEMAMSKFADLVTAYNDAVNQGRVDLACGRINTAKAMCTEAREHRNAARDLVRSNGLKPEQFNCSREPVAQLEQAIEGHITAIATAKADAERQAKLAQELKLQAEHKAKLEALEKAQVAQKRTETLSRLDRTLNRFWTERQDNKVRCAMCAKHLADEIYSVQAVHLVDRLDQLEAFLAVGEERFGLQLGVACGHRAYAKVIIPVFHTRTGMEIEEMIVEEAVRRDKRQAQAA